MYMFLFKDSATQFWKKWRDDDSSMRGHTDPLGGSTGGGTALGDPGLKISFFRRENVFGDKSAGVDSKDVFKRASKEPLRLRVFIATRPALCMM